MCRGTFLRRSWRNSAWRSADTGIRLTIEAAPFATTAAGTPPSTLPSRTITRKKAGSSLSTERHTLTVLTNLNSGYKLIVSSNATHAPNAEASYTVTGTGTVDSGFGVSAMFAGGATYIRARSWSDRGAKH